MHLKKFKTLLVTCSLTFALAACGDAPRGEICAIDSPSRLKCRKPDNSERFIPTGNAINYLCMDPDYAEKLFQYWSQRCQK